MSVESTEVIEAVSEVRCGDRVSEVLGDSAVMRRWRSSLTYTRKGTVFVKEVSRKGEGGRGRSWPWRVEKVASKRVFFSCDGLRAL